MLTSQIPKVFSKKVFVGGLPFDITEADLRRTFNHFGNFQIEWDSRSIDKKYRGGKQLKKQGFVFLIFDYELSVQEMLTSDICFHDARGHYYASISSVNFHQKTVQVRPWRLTDCSYIPDLTAQLNPRNTVFIGALPRPTKAEMLATILSDRFGSVCYAGIDVDPLLDYPMGAARITFKKFESFVAAISGRYVNIPNDGCVKRVEIKPYVVEDQPCDNCNGKLCGQQPAPFFCPDVTCLQYYCKTCWAVMHRSTPENIARALHKPFGKMCG